MMSLEAFIDVIRARVRSFAYKIAKKLNVIFGGRISPNAITLIGLVMHVPIAWLIAQGNLTVAAILLVIFGSFDALDGALARLQKKSSNSGMLLDASTDRIKEVILYCGVAIFLADIGNATMAVWAVAACGSSLCVSYVKAKGEVAVPKQKFSPNEVNRLFQDGLGRFEIRMFLLIMGLLFSMLEYALIAITAISTYTVFERLLKIIRKLESDR